MVAASPGTIEVKPDPHDVPPRILIVEDNFLVAADLASTVRSLGYAVIGPVASVNDGLRLAGEEDLSMAILDINVTGGSVRPVAEALRNRHTPFVFITGYASPDLDPEMLHYAKRLLKPIDAMTLEKVLAEELGEV